jgi:phosphoglycolate phosphatase
MEYNLTHRTLLFDLDGTLTDSQPGITASIRFALERMGVPSPSTAELSRYIGPPLRETLKKLLNTTDPKRVEAAMALYRERFSDTGLFENSVYDGVISMLEQLTEAGYPAYVATSKPTVFARRVVHYFQLDGFFQRVYGAELDGRNDNKADLLRALLTMEDLDPARTVMIGDRQADITAAKANGVTSVGILWGYGSIEELQKAGADYVCETPADVVELILSLP